MRFRWLSGIGVLAAIAAVFLAIAGCGPKTEPGTTSPGAEPAAQVTYTVDAGELENPENKPVYVCPMEQHRDQVSLDPDARCRLCSMKLVPMEEAEKAWGESGG